MAIYDGNNKEIREKKVLRRKRISEDESILKKNAGIIIGALFGCSNPVQVETSTAFATYLNMVGINRKNYNFFFRMLETNNQWVANALIGIHEPKLLFSNIPANRTLIRKAFRMLSFWHPRQIYSKNLQAILGIIENAYYNPDDGYNIYKIKINDLDNLGKFLDKDKNQEYPENKMVLNILDKITQLGEYKEDLNKSVISKHSFNIRFAYFDHRKKLEDIIPQLLLVKIPREESEIKPSAEFIKYIRKSEGYSGKIKED
jgi:hypothetical protein